MSQALLSVAAQLHHRPALQIILDIRVDPACPALVGLRSLRCSMAQRDCSKSEHVSSSACKSLEGDGQSNLAFDELTQGPLAWTAFTGNLSLVTSIRNRGIDPNLVNRNGEAAIAFAVQRTEIQVSFEDVEAAKIAVVQLLLQRGATVNFQGAEGGGGSLLLAQALKAGYHRLANLLVNSGIRSPASASEAHYKGL